MLFQLLLAVRIVHGLDDTTQITCTNSVVKVEETLAGGCQATLRDGGSAVDGLFSDLGLVVDSGTIGNVDPPSGTATAFTFDVTMEATSGEFAMTNNVNVSSLTITVFDEPDSTSTFLCPSVVAVDTPFNCSSIPKNNGQRIWAFDRFVVTGISGTDAIEWTQMTQAGVANAFVIEGVTSVSATYTMSNGLTPTSLLEVTDAADSTSSIECAAATFAVNDEIECTIFARKEGVPVTVPRSSFTITGVTDLTAYRDFRPALGKQFYFFLTVLGFDQTGPWILQDGVSAIGFPLTVVTAPDSTSQLTCDEEVAVGGKARCTISPRLKSKPIWAARSAWVVGAVDEGGDSVGSFSALAPASEGAAEFTFAFTTTANMMADDQIFVNDGLSQTSTLRLVATTTADDTSTLTCETSVADVGQAVLCSIHARASDTTVYTTANTFTVTDGMQEGLFSGYNNTAGAYFGFTYTPSKQGTITLSCKPAQSIFRINVGTSEPTPAPLPPPSPGPPIAPTNAQSKPQRGGGGSAGVGAAAAVIVIVLLLLCGCVALLWFRYRGKEDPRASMKADLCGCCTDRAKSGAYSVQTDVEQSNYQPPVSSTSPPPTQKVERGADGIWSVTSEQEATA